MKVIQLPDVLHEYLLELIQNHSARGIHPEEGMAINRLWEAVAKRVTTIPDADIQKMVAAASPSNQSPIKSVEVVDHTGQTISVECQKCWDDDGSQGCIRPAHATTKSYVQNFQDQSSEQFWAK